MAAVGQQWPEYGTFDLKNQRCLLFQIILFCLLVFNHLFFLKDKVSEQPPSEIDGVFFLLRLWPKLPPRSKTFAACRKVLMSREYLMWPNIL